MQRYACRANGWRRFNVEADFSAEWFLGPIDLKAAAVSRVGECPGCLAVRHE